MRRGSPFQSTPLRSAAGGPVRSWGYRSTFEPRRGSGAPRPGKYCVLASARGTTAAPAGEPIAGLCRQRDLTEKEPMQACCRCKNAAGFWVMAKDAQVVRRPWCLSCISEILDLDRLRLTRIEAVPRPRRAFVRGDRPLRPDRDRLGAEKGHRRRQA